MNRTTASLLLIASCALLYPARTAAAQVGAPTREGVSLSPYLWMSSLDGRVGVGRVATKVDLSFSDIIDKLDFAVMASAGYRRRHWVGYLDVLYVALGDEAVVAFRGDTGSFSLSQHETMLQPMGGYTFTRDTWALDLLAGRRYWNLKTTLDVDLPRRTATSSHAARMEWVDAIGGVAVHWTATDKLHFAVAGDGGGGGSANSWQVSASGNYDVWKQVSLGASYRALWVDYDRDDRLFDTRTTGVLVAVTFHF